jgi:hypothetical protein
MFLPTRINLLFALLYDINSDEVPEGRHAVAGRLPVRLPVTVPFECRTEHLLRSKL